MGPLLATSPQPRDARRDSRKEMSLTKVRL